MQAISTNQIADILRFMDNVKAEVVCTNFDDSSIIVTVKIKM